MNIFAWLRGRGTPAPAPMVAPVAPPATAPSDLIRSVCDQLWFDHRVPNGKTAEAMMRAIGWQESRLTARDQIVAGKAPGQVGPATGFWQIGRAHV